jgi:hypothetical protein
LDGLKVSTRVDNDRTHRSDAKLSETQASVVKPVGRGSPRPKRHPCTTTRQLTAQATSKSQCAAHASCTFLQKADLTRGPMSG